MLPESADAEELGTRSRDEGNGCVTLHVGMGLESEGPEAERPRPCSGHVDRVRGHVHCAHTEVMHLCIVGVRSLALGAPVGTANVGGVTTG